MPLKFSKQKTERGETEIRRCRKHAVLETAKRKRRKKVKVQADEKRKSVFKRICVT